MKTITKEIKYQPIRCHKCNAKCSPVVFSTTALWQCDECKAIAPLFQEDKYLVCVKAQSINKKKKVEVKCPKCKTIP